MAQRARVQPNTRTIKVSPSLYEVGIEATKEDEVLKPTVWAFNPNEAREVALRWARGMRLKGNIQIKFCSQVTPTGTNPINPEPSAKWRKVGNKGLLTQDPEAPAKVERATTYQQVDNQQSR